jgi:hypothetical protein
MAAREEPQSLSLLVEDEEDLSIVSVYLQDAIVRLGDIAYLPKSRRFAFLANRYCWECDREGVAGSRKLAGIHFDSVIRAKSTQIRRTNPDAMLQLLAVRFSPANAQSEDKSGVVDLCFAGGGCIRLDVECIDAALRDLSTPWQAQMRPAHPLEGE